LTIFSIDTIDAPLNGTGVDYLGILANTKRGPCQPWNEHEPQHNWAHNYCRNPKGNKKEKPWCYIAKGKWEYCDIPKVSAKECKFICLFSPQREKPGNVLDFVH
jgi:hypothetical protein